MCEHKREELAWHGEVRHWPTVMCLFRGPSNAGSNQIIVIWGICDPYTLLRHFRLPECERTHGECALFCGTLFQAGHNSHDIQMNPSVKWQQSKDPLGWVAFVSCLSFCCCCWLCGAAHIVFNIIMGTNKQLANVSYIRQTMSLLPFFALRTLLPSDGRARAPLFAYTYVYTAYANAVYIMFMYTHFIFIFSTA